MNPPARSRLRLRPDLVAQQQVYHGQVHWLVKDPVALRYYRFEADEYELIQALDGRTSLRELEQRFAGTFLADEIPQFVSRLVQAGLVTADVPEIHRQRAQPERPARGGIGSLLCLRVPLCDPHRLLTWLDRRLGWLFSPAALFLALALFVSALTLVLSQFETFSRRLPSFGEFFGPANLHWLGLALLVVKVVHEFGHGLACRRFGGECHEMGVLLLVMTPCLYCDVSDCWMLPSKWRRAAVGAAGMYFELIVAALATFVWWWTEPGVLNGLALNIMFISSVSTMLINLNPLMRYDGYYILADLLEIPNLRQKSTAAVWRLVARFTLGVRTSASQMPDERGVLLLVYGVLALVYRLFVSVSILIFLYYVLEPYGLQSIGQCVAATLLVSQVILPLRRGARTLRMPGRWSQVNKFRLLASGMVAAGAVVLLVGLPVPQWVACPFFIQAKDAAPVYVDVGGRLVELHVRAGDYVQAGQPIATLENLDLSVVMVELESRREQLVARRQQLDERALHDENAALEMQQIERTLEALEAQIAQRREDCRRLVLRAPREGMVMPLPRRPRGHAEGELPRWTGSLLDTRNLGAHLQPGEAICAIGDPRESTAILALAQEQLEFVTPGAHAELFPVSWPSTSLDAQISHVARRAMTTIPESITVRAGGSIAAEPASGGQQRPLAATYQASVELEDADERLVSGTTGWAKVHVGRCTLGQHLYRWAEQTLRCL